MTKHQRYQVKSPKNERRQAERAAIAAGGEHVVTHTCRFCRRPFRTTNKYVYYCCQEHRGWHLSINGLGLSYQQETRYSTIFGGIGR